MTIYQTFLAVTGAGLCYFLLSRRTFDFLTLGYVSAVIYFLPGFTGFTLAPPTPASPVKLPTPIVPGAYSIMILVMLAILVAGFLNDLLFTHPTRPERRRVSLFEAELSPVLAIWLSTVGLIFTVLTIGPTLLSGNKEAVLGSLNVWYLVWSASATVMAALAFCYRRPRILGLAILFLLFDLLLGFRNNAAVTFLMIATLWFSSRGSQRFLVESWRPAVLVLFGGFFFFLWHSVKARLRLGDWGHWFDLLQQPYYYVAVVAQSEPFATQHILNEVVRQEFRVGMDHLSDLMAQFMLFAPSLGGKPISFNELFQPAIFPDVQFGLGSNIWAQMWSAGGEVFVIGFAALYALSLVLGSQLLVRTRDPALRALHGLIFTYGAFYIHRNDIFTQVGLEKRVILVWLMCVLGSMLLAGAARSAKPGSKDEPGSSD